MGLPQRQVRRHNHMGEVDVLQVDYILRRTTKKKIEFKILYGLRCFEKEKNQKHFSNARLCVAALKKEYITVYRC